jgi:hypothetical protein
MVPFLVYVHAVPGGCTRWSRRSSTAEPLGRVRRRIGVIRRCPCERWPLSEAP